MALPPSLSPEQRAAALEKAGLARKARAELKERLKMGSLSLSELLSMSDRDEVVGKTKVLAALEALPGVGKVKARRTMEEIGIAETRRLRGLGKEQRSKLLNALLTLLVTISGLPGSGTSTVARGVADRLGIQRLDGGTVWRTMAAELGLSVAEFSALCEGDPAYDLELDRRLAARAGEGDVLLESRLAGWIATNEGLAATRVWLSCSPEERARRVAEREDTSTEAALAANRTREASEGARYQAYYGIELGDLSIYDLVLDSTATAPLELIDTILRVQGIDE